MKSLEERFWLKVDKFGPNGCWLWKGKQRKGYGRIYATGSQRLLSAHRVSYELVKGPIAPGVQVDHICFRRACVNPDHLRLVTNKQNLEHQSGAHRDSRTGVRGVSWHRASGRWQAQITHNNQTIGIGYFATIQEAAEAARRKRLELFTHNDIDRIPEGKTA